MGKKKETKQDSRPEAEIKAEKKANFTRVCKPRVNKALKAIGLVGLCTSSNYIYSKEQAAAVVLALETSVKEVKARFSGEAAAAGGFELPE